MKKPFDVRGAKLCACSCWLLILLVITASLWPVLAQTAPAAAPRSSNRYLFMVETSKAMQRRTNAVLTVVNNLMATGMKGQLQTGDTIGIWTFNQEVHDGRFPLQEWSPKAARMVASAMLMFLESEKWEKTTKLDPVVTAMKDLVKDSENLTVVLISSGEENVIGTPFDAVINESFNSWKADQKKQQMPFVTVFRGANGQLVKAAVTPVPWEIEIPRVTPTNAPSAIVARPKANPPIAQTSPPVPALIVTGKKSPVASLSNTVAESSVPNTAIQQPAASPTNSPATSVGVSPAMTETHALASTTAGQPSNMITSTSVARSVVEANSSRGFSEANPVKTARPIAARPVAASASSRMLHNKKLWIAFGGMILLLAILFIFSRRSPPEDRISLITKSIDLKKK